MKVFLGSVKLSVCFSAALTAGGPYAYLMRLGTNGNPWKMPMHSKELADLEPVFRTKAERFINACREAGIATRVHETRRSPELQYFMYWTWQIGMEGYSRTRHPEPPAFGSLAQHGKPIDWFWKNPEDHDLVPEAEAWGVPSYVADSRRCAQNYFGLVRKPGVTGKFSEGKALTLAVPMLPGQVYRLKDATGKVHVISPTDVQADAGPQPGVDATSNGIPPWLLEVWGVAASYGVHVIKQPEFAHFRGWSDDGTY